MRDLKTHREGWEEMEREERRLADELTIAKSVSIFLSLCDTMAPLLKETDDLFRHEREVYLTELQARLLRLDAWRHQHGSRSEPF